MLGLLALAGQGSVPYFGGGETSPPPPDSEEPAGPLLNDLSSQSNYVIASPDPYQSIRITFSLNSSVAYPVSYKAYLGRPNLLQLNADGVSASNFIQQTSTTEPGSSNRFLFISPETSQRYKVIVIAQSIYGNSSKEIITTPPAIPGGPCAGAVALPVTLGNCAQHCVEATLNGTRIELVSRFNNPALMAYLYMDLTTSYAGGAGPTPFQYVEQFDAPAGIYEARSDFDRNTYTNACFTLSSYQVNDDGTAGGFSDHYLNTTITVP
ncbi:hypothetical protein EHQ12_16985 [Leptospira gomenensis]|uniref:Uncharacterized protein n=1 Tax=Leptospira gomenensis TaxID=2484974 RepID=A0A5F1YXQ4_9LEPT|nr:hypothetical protein [Leptospira gomenensis]TGK29517.1 hypothetical protein EHQ17_16225 [Leptospira gomenensis]TGK33915.1 hypothetical protein EHQ12_16985 [Leptospira gomenensis]TGK44821.1 hypothetical protein EHQ07_11065 [Leptospira gomenensis]TGK64440.1 hypothetical protein EHQ13_07145 [Leptospira gomenensis]